MTKHMLIDATHPEETRVVVVSGKRLEEFDAEIASKKALKGNIYLAKIVRVEPSLQAAFVDYGGNRHGFLAFNEIHPDYYRIPIADREALQAELEAEAAANERSDDDDDDDADDSAHTKTEGAERVEAEPASDDADLIDSTQGEDGNEAGGEGEGEGYRRGGNRPADYDRPDSYAMPEFSSDGEASEDGDDAAERAGPDFDSETEESASEDRVDPDDAARSDDAMALRQSGDSESRVEGPLFETDNGANEGMGDRDAAEGMAAERGESIAGGAETRPDELPAAPVGGGIEDRAPVVAAPLDVVGGDEAEEDDQPRRPRSLRRYKIQEVIKRRQIMLVQVTKEERGNKGAALTTYLSLAGRYCVLMPNTARGGGVSRKITSANDRKRLKSVIGDLEIPKGMAVIVRTAGSERNRTEIKRDYEYLLRLWGEIRDLTLRSTAPALIYEEANLIKRSIRDLYTRDIEDIQVEGDEGYKAAKAFMKMLTPSHARRVIHYRDPSMPLFQRHQVETQLDALHNPTVQLRSGGYIVINQTEALVAIDVNSGRATRERNIEDTALRTNMEAAEEIARQLRLRDLAGLIVIDFIDMEEQRHNAQVERRLKEAMRTDRARIQIGRISPFGLLELSRQRLRPSLVEASTEICRLCRGLGRVRSTESTALHVLRGVEEEGTRRRSPGITVTVPTAVALFILNQKRRALAEIEIRHGFRVYLTGDDHLIPPEYRIERLRALAPGEELPMPATSLPAPAIIDEPDDEIEVEEEVEIEDRVEPEESEDAVAKPREPRAERGDRGGDRGDRGDRAEQGGENDRGGRRRRRRRRGGRGRDGEDNRREGGRDGDGPRREGPAPAAAEGPAEDQTRRDDFVAEDRTPPEATESQDNATAPEPREGQEETPGAADARRRRRRGRRGGRRRSRRRQEGGLPGEAPQPQVAGEHEPEEQQEPSRGPRPLVTPADFDRDWPYNEPDDEIEDADGNVEAEAPEDDADLDGEEAGDEGEAPVESGRESRNDAPAHGHSHRSHDEVAPAASHATPTEPARTAERHEPPVPSHRAEEPARVVLPEPKSEPQPTKRGWWRRGS
ncbi:MAG: Rne/Rng family ribonuclease [Hypericibacter sp.]